MPNLQQPSVQSPAGKLPEDEPKKTARLFRKDALQEGPSILARKHEDNRERLPAVHHLLQGASERLPRGT